MNLGAFNQQILDRDIKKVQVNCQARMNFSNTGKFMSWSVVLFGYDGSSTGSTADSLEEAARRALDIWDETRRVQAVGQ